MASNIKTTKGWSGFNQLIFEDDKTDQTSYILWLGPVVNEQTLIDFSPAVSPAANRWQHGLLCAMQDCGASISVIGHVPDSLWPKGTFRMRSNHEQLAPLIKGRLICYWNIPFLRTISLSRQYLRTFLMICHTQGKPAVVMTYNDYPWNATVGLYAQKHLDIPWVCVVADGPGIGRKYVEHEGLINRATARVFLSWGRFRDCHHGPKIHLDSGIKKLHFHRDSLHSNQSKKSIVFFSGSMERWAGVDFLVESFMKVKKNEAELWLCGYGNNLAVQSAVKKDRRIKYLGLLSEDKLRQVSEEVSVFVNPRLSSIASNRSNYPSKVLEYLSYGKPVISTWTDGLSPEYADILIIPKNDSTSCLAETIDSVLAWDESDKKKNSLRIYNFLNSGKYWATQAQKLCDWLKDENIINTITSRN
jgi:glycosyltransferase involved in cell wall biosynthesis